MSSRIAHAVGLSVLTVWWLAAMAVGSQPVRAADGPSLTVSPDSVTLGPGDTRTVVVLLTNSGADALTTVVLSIVDTGGVVVNPDQPTTPETVVGGATLAHTYTLKMPANGLGETAVIVRADFTTVPPPSGASPAPPASPAATAAPPVPGVLTASVAVKPAALGISAAVAAASGSVSQVNPGTVNVTVTNSGARSFDATVKPRALSAGESSVTYAPETQVLSAIAPGDSAVATFTVTPGNAIHPGELLLLFDVTADGADGRRVIVASGTLTLSVFGETEFSGPLGVPTFYVVPGVIMLVAWSLFGGWFGPLSTRSLPSADGKAFWVLAIALSLLMALLLYPLVTSLLAMVPIIVSSRRDYLHGYGTVDVGLLWGLSFLLPLIVYTIPRLILAWVNRYEPGTNDKAWKLLSKLAAKQMQAGLPAVTNATGAAFSGFALEKRESGKDHYWIGPGIVAKWNANQDAAMARLQAAAERELTLKGDLGVLQGHLKEAKKANGVTLDYDRGAGIDGPQQAATKDLTFQPDGVIVKSSQGD